MYPFFQETLLTIRHRRLRERQQVLQLRRLGPRVARLPQGVDWRREDLLQVPAAWPRPVSVPQLNGGRDTAAVTFDDTGSFAGRSTFCDFF